MSGGYFDYIQFRIEEAADSVAHFIARCESTKVDEYEYKPEFSKETLDKFKECRDTLKKGAKMLHRIDWLASGDDGEETFHKQWREDIENKK